MLWINHLVGGFVFTGVTASLLGDNLLDSPYKIGVCLFASLLPDIDTPRSPVGFAARPFSSWLETNYGHRTITHSLLILALATLVFALLRLYPLIFFLSYLSHLIFDMMTKMGVPLFYPFSKNICAFGGRDTRMTTGDLKAESVSLASFLLVGITLQPLMNQGFWTTYNSQFGTQKHLASEFHKSKDLLEAEYYYTVGSQDFRGKGYVIEATPQKTILIQNDKFLEITPTQMNVKQITFTHTNKPFKIENTPFVGVSCDSLNALVASKRIIEIEVVCNQNAQNTEGGVLKDFHTLKREYPQSLFFSVKDTHINQKPFFNLPSITAKIKRQQIESIRAEYADNLRKWELSRLELQSLVTDTTRDYLRKEKILRRIDELKHEKPPELDIYRIRNLEYEATMSEQQEALQNQIEYQKYLLQQKEEQSKIQKPQFSGFIKYVVLG